jgi:hypothetical protein
MHRTEFDEPRREKPAPKGVIERLASPMTVKVADDRKMRLWMQREHRKAQAIPEVAAVAGSKSRAFPIQGDRFASLVSVD